jgi:hypothetical protein
MDDRKKVMMMTELGILGSLYELTRSETVVGGGCRLDLVTSNATQIEAVAAVAKLINARGLALIQGWEQDMTSLSLVVQMEQCLHLPLTCLSYDSIDVSGASSTSSHNSSSRSNGGERNGTSVLAAAAVEGNA